MIEIPKPRRATYLRNCRVLALLSAVASAFYLQWLLFSAVPENLVLYWLLVAAEVFNIAQAAGFWLTISSQKWSEPPVPDFARGSETVDVFVTVRGEPFEIVEHTLRAAMAVRHPRKRVWVLDDGPSEAVRDLATRQSAGYVTRPDHRGAKAGAINNALSLTDGAFFAVFDADQAPHPDFLEATMGAFNDADLAFVQTPQVYRNRSTNRVAAGAHDQQALFYGPILRGKNGMGAVFCCGTNVVFRRRAVEKVGGFPEDSVTEDLRLTLMLLRAKFRSIYVSTVLAEGLGPLDVGSYLDQQLRWGRGGLDILLRRRPYFLRMSPGQVLQFTLGFLYWFTGWAYLAYLVLPVTYLAVGLRPIAVPNDYPVYFLPYVLMALATIVYATDLGVTFSALWFTLAAFPVHVRALLSTIAGRKARFVITPKVRARVSLRPVVPLLLTIAVLVVAAVVGIVRDGPQPSVVNNIAWIVAHIVLLQGFVRLTFFPEVPGGGSAEEPLFPRSDDEPVAYPATGARSEQSS